MKLIINICSYVLLLVLFNSVNLTQQLPDLSVDKVSDVNVESDSKVSGYKKAHGSHKEADSDGWKNLKSSSKGKLDKAKQDAEMYLGEGKHKVKKENGFHAESDLHKSKDKGMDKKWNRGDGIMKTWNWNKGWINKGIG
uniref:Uncharacterized protein n=1 Tax=Tetranychus urticae TaxID=32264 RepID=T1L2H3_TETUR